MMIHEAIVGPQRCQDPSAAEPSGSNTEKHPDAFVRTERRRSWRRPLGTLATLSRLIGSEEVNPVQVLVLNVSHGGVGMRSAVSFRIGATYRLRIGNGLEHPAARLRIIYVRSRGEGVWDVGGEYVTT